MLHCHLTKASDKSFPGGLQEETYMVVEISGQEHQQTARTVEEVEVYRALFELYEGAVVRHL